METHRDKRKEALCKDCPLDGQNKVYGQHLGEDPRIVFIGEAPGSEEDKKGEPFVGPAGMQLKKAIGYTRISFAFAHKMNVINCRPPNNKIDSSEGEIAIDQCRKGFLEELKRVLEKGAKVIVPLGNTAMKALQIDGTITKNRGSVFISPVIEKMFPKKIIPVLPSYHPSFILRGQFKEVPTWIADLKKAWELTKKEYKPPKENFIIFPELNDVIKFKYHVIENKKLVGVDIETVGLDPLHPTGQIVMVGLSYDESNALVIPFLGKDKKSYWNWEEERVVKAALKEIIGTCDLLFQNALFDAFWLEQKIGPCKNIKHDVMICHHSLNPELKHNLGYITSVYGKTPYWKDLNLKGEKAIFALCDEEFRTYNARDAVVLHQILPELLKDVREDGLLQTYERGIALIYPLLEMHHNGIPIDEKALKNYRSSLKRKITISKKKLYSLGNLPESFNLNSGDDMRYFLFGIEPTKSKRAKLSLKEYDDPNCKKKKNTKKYQKLLNDLEIIQKVQPFQHRPKYQKKTDSGNLKADNEVLQDFYKELVGRKAEIHSFRKKRTSHTEELKILDREIEIISEILVYNKSEKEFSTYTSFFVPDGKVHPKYLIHGTNTGRLASRSPNGQNLSKGVKKVFKADPGRTFIQADYSNLELRVLAYISRDKNLLEVFKKGLNVHTENCKTMFGLTEESPMWEAARHACKTYQFGRNYGGTLQGIYRRVINQVPQLHLSRRKFEEIDRQYKKDHPEQEKWSKEVKALAKRERISINAFGRKRYLLGSYQEMEREALNNPIQSTAADIMNMGLINIKNDKRKEQLKIALHGTVHDSVLISCPNKNVKKAVLFLKENCEIDITINKMKCTFPVDFEIGVTWGELQEYKL